LAFSGCNQDVPGSVDDGQRNDAKVKNLDTQVIGVISVILNNAATLNTIFYDYTPEDFSYVNCFDVVEASGGTLQIARQQLIAQETGDWSELQERISLGMLLNLNIISRILYISVYGESVETIVNYADILRKKAEIQSAEVLSVTEPYNPPVAPINKPGTFNDLDLSTELLIEYDYAYTHKVLIEHVNLTGYYGTYNNNAVIFMDGPFFYLAVMTRMTIADLTFSWGSSNVTLVWEPGDGTKAGNFYRLNEAFNMGLLTENDIKSIHERHYPLSKR